MLPSWLITFRAFALACAFAAAFVPIATYITDDKRDWLWIHIGINIAAYIAVALTTIYTTVSLTQQDHNKHRVPAYWSNNVVMRTWYLGVSRTWRWHVVAAVGRLGLALALAQYLHITFVNRFGWRFENNFGSILSPFHYWSYELGDNRGFIPWQAILIGLVVLLGFAILESGLLSAFTLLNTRAKRFRLSRAIFIRIMCFVSVISLMVLVQNRIYNTPNYENRRRSSYTADETREYRIPLKEWHKIAFTWLDNGTMLAAWMMRPTGEGWHGCILLTNKTGDLQDCDEYETGQYIFVDFLAAVTAYMTYILAIIASLQLAQYLHWRREQRESPTPAPTTP